MVTGYLIIYNIFQISVIQDIQSYGQLKTLEQQRRQIKKIIKQTGITFVCVRYPHWPDYWLFIGRALVPALMNGTTYTSEAGVVVTVNPLIFIGSAIFAFATVYISVRKPAKIAGSVSPIEAIRYTENDAGAFQTKKHLAVKKSTSGAKIHRMALANLGRNPETNNPCNRVYDIELVLFNTVFTLSSGFDIDKYVEKFLNKGFYHFFCGLFQLQFRPHRNILV